MENNISFYVNVFETLHLNHKEPIIRLCLMYGMNYFTENEITKIIILSKIPNCEKLIQKKTYRRIKTKFDNSTYFLNNHIKTK